jgi:hypothetical protein
MGPVTKNYCAGEDQQQFTLPTERKNTEWKVKFKNYV